MSDALHCDFCGTGIKPADFLAGRAVVIFQKRYCPDCMKEAVRRSKAKREAAASAVPAPLPAPPAPASPGVQAAPRSTRRLRVGEHGCGLYSTEEERRSQLGPYIREGLENGEKVIHFLKMPTPEKILADFRAVGLPAKPYLQNGQLEILQAVKLLGKPGEFVPAEMAARMLRAADRAIEDGYSRLRVVAEMTWALNSLIDSERLVEYERELTVLAVRGKCTALCQYNVYRFEASSLHNVRTCHPFVFAKGAAEAVLNEVAAAR